MVVSPAVLAHDVSMGIADFPTGWIYPESFEKLRDWGTVKTASTFNQRSANERKGETPQACEIMC